ncbi:TetR/AcrR family transcriptional regulator [Pseudomonas sp. MYb185]|uniref:TetR/AcrR family transcriptional regulator n=1 Tax=Pseudomonas sp. MYb185 TaxID=1848729 RepID=UPI000CFC08E9|nr:TetR/AcrR family transcriptional regulator [Pseudomonas sp. MYb185]PRB76509.1 TetR family transcriptional regulator [Pseudomonas sp. MYb185]
MKKQQQPTAGVERERANSDKPMAKSTKSTRKRAEIVRVAIEIINRKSYALATMTDIAAELGLRDATLYYYYPSKQALAYACHVNSLERFERLLDEADHSGANGLDKLRRFIRGLLIDGERHGPQLYFGDYSYLEAAERAQVDAWVTRLEAVLQGFLDEGVADSSMVPCDTRLVVQLILGMLIWLSKWVPTIEDVTVDSLMQAIGIASLNGLERKPEP